VKLQTRFNLGSMNKMFTAVAALQLVERGKLSLDDTIGKYLGTDWLSQPVLDRVQVKHLLTHTSGLGSYFNEEFVRSSRALFRRVDDYRPLVKSEGLDFEPGTNWKYSNTGMLVAGAVIEKAGGKDYFDYIRENVTGPAGMRDTDSYELDRVNRNLAVGYSQEQTAGGPAWRNNLFEHVIRGGPAGGGYSTVEDLLRFDQALRSGKLLTKASLANLWRAYPELSSPDYGLGFGIESSAAGRIVGHSGGFTGISAHLDMYLDDGWTVAVLSNYGDAAPIVQGKARELITQGR
jgi:CubicO group peptidase (beta-lactamase class C family)